MAGPHRYDPGDYDQPSVKLDRFIKAARDQIGDRYQFGAETSDDDPNPSAFDSSELVEWAAHRAGFHDMPDGSWNQYRYLHDAGAAVSVDEALHTRGALVFGFSSDPLESADRPARAYVGISLGNGKILDISERGGAVREMDPGNFYSYGAKIPEFHAPDDIDVDPDIEMYPDEYPPDPDPVPAPSDEDVVVPDPDDPDGTDPAADGPSPDPAAGPGQDAPDGDTTEPLSQADPVTGEPSGYGADPATYGAADQPAYADQPGYADQTAYADDLSGYPDGTDAPAYASDSSGYPATDAAYADDAPSYASDAPAGYPADTSGYAATGTAYGGDPAGYSATGADYASDPAGYPATDAGDSAGYGGDQAVAYADDGAAGGGDYGGADATDAESAGFSSDTYSDA
jgi:hypothetical protein